MKLQKWLDNKNKDYKWFASKIGASQVAVWYWLNDRRKPRQLWIDKISNFTNQAVKGRDFY